MTISELAKIALEEKRVVSVLKPDQVMAPITFDLAVPALVWLSLEELAADDWYEVTE